MHTFNIGGTDWWDKFEIKKNATDDLVRIESLPDHDMSIKYISNQLLTEIIGSTYFIARSGKINQLTHQSLQFQIYKRTRETLLNEQKRIIYEGSGKNVELSYIYKALKSRVTHNDVIRNYETCYTANPAVFNTDVDIAYLINKDCKSVESKAHCILSIGGIRYHKKVQQELNSGTGLLYTVKAYQMDDIQTAYADMTLWRLKYYDKAPPLRHYSRRELYMMLTKETSHNPKETSTIGDMLYGLCRNWTGNGNIFVYFILPKTNESIPRGVPFMTDKLTSVKRVTVNNGKWVQMMKDEALGKNADAKPVAVKSVVKPAQVTKAYLFKDTAKANTELTDNFKKFNQITIDYDIKDFIGDGHYIEFISKTVPEKAKHTTNVYFMYNENAEKFFLTSQDQFTQLVGTFVIDLSKKNIIVNNNITYANGVDRDNLNFTVENSATTDKLSMLIADTQGKNLTSAEPALNISILLTSDKNIKEMTGESKELETVKLLLGEKTTGTSTPQSNPVQVIIDNQNFYDRLESYDASKVEYIFKINSIIIPTKMIDTKVSMIVITTSLASKSYDIFNGKYEKVLGVINLDAISSWSTIKNENTYHPVNFSSIYGNENTPGFSNDFKLNTIYDMQNFTYLLKDQNGKKIEYEASLKKQPQIFASIVVTEK